MKTLYQYAIVRFLPHAETGEFANVGIVLCAPEQAAFEFRLAPTRFARVTDFFEDVEGKLYKTTITTVQNELKRIKDYTTTVLPKRVGGGDAGISAASGNAGALLRPSHYVH